MVPPLITLVLVLLVVQLVIISTLDGWGTGDLYPLALVKFSNRAYFYRYAYLAGTGHSESPIDPY